MVHICALKYFLVLSAQQKISSLHTFWGADIILSFSVFICKNIDFIRVLRGLDDCSHGISDIFLATCRPSLSLPFPFLYLINFIASVCLLILRFKNIPLKLSFFFFLIVRKLSMRSTFLFKRHLLWLLFLWPRLLAPPLGLMAPSVLSAPRLHLTPSGASFIQ